MKVKHLLRTTLIAATMLLWSGVGWGQVLLVEDFDYDAGELLVDNGWTAHSGAGTSSVAVVTPGLEFPGYFGSGIGNAAGVINTGEDVHKTFAEQTSGTIYAAFIIKTETPNSAGYFLHLGQTNIGTNFFTRVWVNATGDGVGIGASAPTTYVPITAGTPTLIVIKLDYATKISELFVFNTFPTEEPETADASFTETASYTNVGSIALRQYNASQRVIVDGIRVATTWADAVKAIGPTVNLSVSSLTDFSYMVDEGPSVVQFFAVSGVSLTDDISISLPVNYELSLANDPFVAATEAIVLPHTDGIVAETNIYARLKADLAVGVYNENVNITSIDADAKVVALSGEVIAASTPIITLTSTHAGEIYYGGEDITVTWTSANVTTVDLEVWVPSESMWMAVESALPAADGSVTTAPDADTDFATTYKLRLKDADSETYSAESGEFTIRPVAPDLATVRGYAAGTEFRFDGSAIVTYARPSSGRNQKYIQDNNSGILIDDNTGIITEDYPIGSEITGLVGKISVFNALVQVLPLEDPGVPASLGNDVIPFVTDLGSLTSADQGKLIKLSNIVFTSTGFFESGKNYNIKDEAEVTSVFRTAFAEADYIGEDIPTLNIAEMLALVGEYNGTMQLTSRSTNDWLILSDDATLQTFTLGGLDVLPRTGLLVDDPDTDEGATLFVDDFSDFKGIVIAATDDAASVEVYLNTVLVDEANYSTQVLADGDVVVVTVTAEDGTIAYYKVTITGENRVLEITGPALPATYNTGDDIVFTWSATNITNVNIYVVETEVEGEAFPLNEDAPVDATLGTYTYTVVNGDFGTYTVRIEDAADDTFFAETTEVLTVVDNVSPDGVEFYPAWGDVDVPVSFTLSIQFDEDIEAGTGNITINKVSDDTEVLSFTETDFTINNDMLTIDVSGLAFETEYYILADAGVIKDLSGNETPALDDKTVWTFTTMEEPAGDLFISEYIEGSSNNKALELYNPTSSTIDLTQYVIKQANNGNGWGNTSSGPDTRYVLPLTGTLESGKVLVLANASANPAITAVADYTFAYDNTANGSDGSNVLAFNGDDAIGLFKNDVLIDVIGDPDNDPGTNWVVAGTGATSEYTLVRKPGITMGNTNWAASAGTNADDSEWIVHPQDEFSFIGWHGNEPTLSISSPADGSTIYDDKVTVSFAVYNFQVGDNSGGDDDGYVVYKLNAGDEVELKTTDDFELTGLALGEYTLTMWLVDNNGDVLNPEVSRSVTFTIEEISVLTIYEVRYTTEDPALSPYQGEVVTTKGIVTGAYFYSGNERGFFIQDGVTAWNGIMVYTNTATGNPAIGDEVQVTGKVDHFFNLVQITNSPTFEVLSSDNDVPAPKVLTTAEVAANPAGYQWQSMLLRVEDAECTDNAPGNGRFLVNDGSGVLSIDPGLYAFDPATIEVDKKYNITGFGLFAFSEHRLAPRNASDIELVTSAGVVTEENINVYPNPFSQTLWIDNVQNARSVVVVNLIGQQVVNMQLHGDSRVSIPTEKLPSGVYLISVEGQDGERTVRKVIKR